MSSTERSESELFFSHEVVNAPIEQQKIIEIMIDVMLRYLVDGRWCTNPLLTIYNDENNNENHIISVPESTNISISRVINRL